MTTSLLSEVKEGDIKSLARSISIVENEAAGYESLLQVASRFRYKDNWYHRPTRCREKHYG